MKELNSVQMGTAAGAIARLPRPVDFPKGRGCARIRCEATIPVKNNTAGAVNLTGASVKEIIACIFKTSSLRFGDKQAEPVDTAIDYARAREMALAMTGDDFFIVGEAAYKGGAATRIQNVADADVIFTAVAAGATVNLVVEFFRAFELARLGEDAYRYCPGATQMKQIQWEFVRGSTFATIVGWVQGAAADLLFIVDDFEAHDDKWAAVPRLYQQEEAGRVSHGPKAPVGLISMWDYNAVGASTALSLFSIKRQGDAPIHETVNAKRVVRDALYTDPPGMYDVNALATVLHNLPAGSEVNDIPTGAGFTFEQTGTELNPPRTAWLHIPARTQEEIDDLVGENVADSQGVKLIGAAAKTPKGVSGPAASLEPVILARRDDSDFEALPGRVVGVGIQPTTHIPTQVAAAASAAAKAATDPGAAYAAAGKAAGTVSKALPGFASAVRGRKTAAFGALRDRLK